MSNRCTEIKTVKINADCVNNPVFIRWINSVGGWEPGWVFSRTQTIAVQVDELGTFQPYNADIEVAESVIEVLAKDATPQMIVGAFVDIEDIERIKGMLYSPSVKMLMNNDTWMTEGCKWQTIIPQPGAFKLYDTIETKTQIEIIFDMPKLYLQQQ